MIFYRLVFPLILILTASEVFGQTSDSAYYRIKEKNIKSVNDRRTAAREALKTGDLSYDANYFQAAIKSYDEAIEIDPSLVEAYFGRARAKEQLNDLRGALTDYDLVIHLNPQHNDGYFNRGKLKITLKEYQAALRDFYTLLDLPENNKNTIYFEGVIEGEEETPTLTKISNVSKENAEAYNYIGLAKEGLGDFKGALAAFDKAIELKPDFATFYLNRADLKYSFNQLELAIRDYEKVLQLNPDNKEAFYKIRDYKRMISTSDSTEYEYYEKSIDEGKNMKVSYLSRAVIKFNRGDLNGALKDYDSAIKLDDQDPEAFINRGIVKEKLKIYEGAISDFTKTLELKPDLWKAYYNRGNSKFKQNKFAESVPDFTKALELNATEATIFFNRGLAEYLSKQPDQACKDWQTAFDMGYLKAAEKIKEFCEDN